MEKADTTAYEPLMYNTTTKTKEVITNTLKRLQAQGFLNTTFTDYCLPPAAHRTSVLYFLKKIHKTPMGIRPIVSSTNSITENISEFVDHWLLKHMKEL